MGTTGAIGMAEATTNGDITLETAIGWHLTSNHYPPIPSSMTQPCIDAIDAAIADDWDKEIPLPNGVSYQGKSTAPAWTIVMQHHLEPWIEAAFDEGDE